MSVLLINITRRPQRQIYVAFKKKNSKKTACDLKLYLILMSTIVIKYFKIFPRHLLILTENHSDYEVELLFSQTIFTWCQTKLEKQINQFLSTAKRNQNKSLGCFMKKMLARRDTGEKRENIYRSVIDLLALFCILFLFSCIRPWQIIYTLSMT